ncbi:MAG: farnesyl diphosphate synthase [Pseudomonadota bacterium]
MSDAFTAELAGAAARVEGCLETLLPRPQDGDARIAEAMRYAALGPGKRMRAFLTLGAAALFAVPPLQALRVAAAIECLHAYSLVHDDLPCMDDDDLRRGRPTLHRRWDEATAVLAGDALQCLAFGILADPATHKEGEIRAALCAALARAAGAAGMVGGQALDIAAESADHPLGLDEITRLQALKTGALIGYAAEAGAILGAAGARARAELIGYAQALGLAFQIHDDILDVTGDASEAGKRLRKDETAGKATFVSLLGLDGARAKAGLCVEEALSRLEAFGPPADPLRRLAHFTITRSR